MITKQEHSSTGDNIAGNKYEQNVYSNHETINSILSSKIVQIKNSEDLDLKDNNVIKALKEVIKELIEQEQIKSHQLVPIGNIREKFKNLFDDKTFELLVKQLISEKAIEIEETQICFTPKQTKYKVNI